MAGLACEERNRTVWPRVWAEGCGRKTSRLSGPEQLDGSATLCNFVLAATESSSMEAAKATLGTR